MSSENALGESLPYWEFQSEPVPHTLLWDGSVSSGFEILPLDIECFDESRINQLTLGLRAFANSLPEGLTCQFMVKVESDIEEVLKKHVGLITTENTFLKTLDSERSSSIDRQVQAGLIFRPRLLFFLKTEGAERPGVFAFSQTKKFAKDFESGFDDRLQSLGQALEGAQASLSSLGFTSIPTKREDFVELLYQHFNPRRCVDTASPRVSPRDTDIDESSPRSQIVFGDLILDREDFVLDGLRTRVITLKTLPEMTFAGMMSGFLALPFKYELLFSFKIPEQAKEIKSLEQKRRMAHSLSSSSSNRVSDLESES